jgi:hypothetical protein
MRWPAAAHELGEPRAGAPALLLASGSSANSSASA